EPHGSPDRDPARPPRRQADGGRARGPLRGLPADDPARCRRALPGRRAGRRPARRRRRSDAGRRLLAPPAPPHGRRGDHAPARAPGPRSQRRLPARARPPHRRGEGPRRPAPGRPRRRGAGDDGGGDGARAARRRPGPRRRDPRRDPARLLAPGHLPLPAADGRARPPASRARGQRRTVVPVGARRGDPGATDLPPGPDRRGGPDPSTSGRRGSDRDNRPLAAPLRRPGPPGDRDPPLRPGPPPGGRRAADRPRHPPPRRGRVLGAAPPLPTVRTALLRPGRPRRRPGRRSDGPARAAGARRPPRPRRRGPLRRPASRRGPGAL
ncbi:MAG: Transcriptional regulator, DeoR family, partial [uncultured Thermomicrobiales bacterium]